MEKLHRNQSQHLVAYLSEMRRNHKFCDTTLILDDGSSFYGHSVVLARSEVLCNVISSMEYSIPFGYQIYLQGTDKQAIRILLDFLYGLCPKNKADYDTLMKSHDFLSVKLLHIAETVFNSTPSPTENNPLSNKLEHSNEDPEDKVNSTACKTNQNLSNECSPRSDTSIVNCEEIIECSSLLEGSPKEADFVDTESESGNQASMTSKSAKEPVAETDYIPARDCASYKVIRKLGGDVVVEKNIVLNTLQCGANAGDGNDVEMVSESAEIMPTNTCQADGFMIENNVDVQEQCSANQISTVENNHEITRDSRAMKEIIANVKTEDEGISEVVFHFEDTDVIGGEIDELNQTIELVEVAGKMHPKDSYLCRLCDKSFAVWNDYRYHCTSVHIETNFKAQCEICKAGFQSAAELQEHKHSAHEPDGNGENRTYCELCKVDMKSHAGLKRHNIRRHCDLRPYICQICGMGFKFRYEAVDHERKVHSTTHDYACTICTKQFTCAVYLKEHMLIHNKHRTFKCDKCESSFTTKRTLKCHLQRHQESKYHCGECGRAFNRSSTLQAHVMYKHLKDLPYKCKQCPKQYVTPGLLRDHVAGKHEGGGRYKCTECEKSFIHKQHLQVHQTVHSDRRQYPCTVCNKSYKSASSLCTHVLTHELQNSPQETLLKCSQCDERFMNANRLRIHVHQAHNRLSSVHKCDICMQGFEHQTQLDAHSMLHRKPKILEHFCM